MAKSKAPRKSAPPAKRDAKSKTFSADEKSAMRERAREQRAAASGAEAEEEVLAKIAEMTKADRAIAERLHALIKASAPSLAPRTWYGMPAYAKDGRLVCHFQPAQKFKTRYATIGFSDNAKLDEGAMWPVSYALKELTAAEEKQIRALIKRALG
ncbi:MAG: DUF1801 domain-containing protein [Candidatus Dormibacteraeota bacterium]|nr:DUF1801 domain-containing protein [Candidatus Dormibacteraeota bacterium]MBV9524238.1 DUF1801 domain-containing protein [Candidatus Dormibacteraeota bacterium]